MRTIYFPVSLSSLVICTVIVCADYEYYSQYGPEAYYAHYYAMHPYYKGYYEELGNPYAQDQGYGEG